MRLIYADIELINGEDLVLARRHIIGHPYFAQMKLK